MCTCEAIFTLAVARKQRNIQAFSSTNYFKDLYKMEFIINLVYVKKNTFCL